MWTNSSSVEISTSTCKVLMEKGCEEQEKDGLLLLPGLTLPEIQLELVREKRSRLLEPAWQVKPEKSKISKLEKDPKPRLEKS